MRQKIFFLVILCLWSWNAAKAEEVSWKSYSYSVVRITDGDTVTLSDGNIRFRLRIAGIDAPESGQPFGKLAQLALKKMIDGRKIQVQPVGSGTDAFNRVLGILFVDGQDVGLELARQGWVYYYRPDCVDYPQNKNKYDYDPRPYVDAEDQAHVQRLNLWAGEVQQMACAYRKTHRR